MRFKNARYVAILIAVIGIVFFSAKAVLVKLAYQYHIPPVSLLLLRMAFALPFYIGVALIKRPAKSDQISSKDYLWVIGLGIIGYYLASLFDFLGLQYIKASLERIILFIYPTLVILISWLIFKKVPGKLQVIAIIISYIGIFITFSEEIGVSAQDNVLTGGLLVFMSALTYASYLVGSGYLIPKFGSVVFTSYAMIVSCLCVVAHYILTSHDDILSYDREVYFLALIMAIMATVIPSYLISYAIKQLGASNFAIIGSLGPVSTISLAYIFLDESLTSIQIVGAVIVIASIVVVSRQSADAA